MPVSFLTAKALKNELKSSLCSQFSNGTPSNLKKLLSSGCNLAAGDIFTSGTCSGCSPTTYGFFIPKVASQAELDDYFNSTSSGEATTFLFFKQDESAEWVLHFFYDLETAFAEGVEVPAFQNGEPAGVVKESNLDQATVIVQSDGGIIIVGVLDTLGTDD